MAIMGLPGARRAQVRQQVYGKPAIIATGENLIGLAIDPADPAGVRLHLANRFGMSHPQGPGEQQPVIASGDQPLVVSTEADCPCPRGVAGHVNFFPRNFTVLVRRKVPLLDGIVLGSGDQPAGVRAEPAG